MNYFTELQEELAHYLDEEIIGSVRQAYQLAHDAHRGQTRRSGEPYITHPVAAATILAKLRMDYQSIMATLLHDTIEDTSVSKDELKEKFGSEVAELVDGVSKLTQIKFETRAEAQAENFRKMVLAMVRDIRVILVKLADRLHNMRTLGVMPAVKKHRIAIETLEIYAPIANRLGMHTLYVELEDLGFAALYPLRYRVIADAVNNLRGNRKEIMSKIEQGLKQSLDAFQVPVVQFYGRQKHLYGIYKKMRDKRASLAEIMDVYGFRIITPSIDACYRAMGAVHRTYKPVPERFKDYIAIPKANGYQSLHTTLFGPYGVPIEVQIRTEEMHKIAENGIAAHWLYKSSGLDAKEAQSRARQWVEGLLEIQQSAGSSLEFIENVKIDLFPDEVYVFTPKGHIMELPRGATPVDFAYAVHSDIGNACVAAKVDRRIAPLSHVLMNGQTVEIITAPGASPNPAWLDFVATGKARSNIRHFLKSQRQAEAVELGKRLLDKALGDLSCQLENIPDDDLHTLALECHFENTDDLFHAIGIGNQVALVIARRLLDMHGENEPCQLKDRQALAIKGTEGMVVKYAECCQPIPGDPIVGCLDPGQGILVHIESCPEVKHFRNRPEKFISMCWEEHVTGDFTVDLVIEVINQRGVLALLASTISEAESNITNISVDPRDGRYNIVHFTLSVHNRGHLARIIQRIRAHSIVNKIYRRKAEG